jgi:hypothetical protein
MGFTTSTIVTAKCERCSNKAEFEHVEVAHKRGWRMVRTTGVGSVKTVDRLACPSCVLALDGWFQNGELSTHGSFVAHEDGTKVPFIGLPV